MKQILTKELYGDEAKFFLQDNLPMIALIEELDREGRSAVKITFEVETNAN